MALKLFRGKAGRVYPDSADLLRFGTEVCRVRDPANVCRRIAQGMSEALAGARADERMPKGLVDQLADQWERGFAYARVPVSAAATLV